MTQESNSLSAAMLEDFYRSCWPVVDVEASLASGARWLRIQCCAPRLRILFQPRAASSVWLADSTESDSVVEYRELAERTQSVAEESLGDERAQPESNAPELDLDSVRILFAKSNDDCFKVLSVTDLQVAFFSCSALVTQSTDVEPSQDSAGKQASKHHEWMPQGGAESLIRLLLDQVAVLCNDDSAKLLSSALRDARLESMAEFAAGAGHEINNPLGSIRGRAELLLRDESDPERRRSLATIGAQVDRVRDMIGDAMLYARPPSLTPVAVDAVEVIHDEIARAEARYESPDVVIQQRGHCEQHWLADLEQLRIVIRAILRNSFEACGDKGLIRVEIKAIDTSGWLQICDNGQRLTDEQQRYAFDPFYSGRSAGRGLGFGLSNSWRIVKAHGGEILLDSHQDRGCTTTILWPLA